MKECVVVLGMHRSGTSVLAGLVSLQGFYLGANAMPSQPDNPKGFFENIEVYNLNQLILKESNTTWEDCTFKVEQIKPDDLQRYKLKAREIIKKEFGLAKRIFIKDPRICLLFPIWEYVLKDLGFKIKIIFVYRSPMEVAVSLKARNDFELEKSLLLWSHYCFQAEKNTRKYDRIVVQYAQDFHDLDNFLKSLAEFLNIKLSRKMAEYALDFYTPKLNHHRIDIDNFSGETPVYLKDFISILQIGNLNQSEELDKIIDEFYWSQELFMSGERELQKNLKDSEGTISNLEHNLKDSKIIISDLEDKIQNVEKNNKKSDEEKNAIQSSLSETRKELFKYSHSTMGENNYSKNTMPKLNLVDIIIPVYNALEYVKVCIDSVLECNDGLINKLIIVNDGSNMETSQFLESFSKDNEIIELLDLGENQGYTKAVNVGLKKSIAEYVVLLNSDTVVSYEWLEKLIVCVESNENNGIVGPLSNAASWQSVPNLLGADGNFVINELPKNTTVNEMAELVSSSSIPVYPSVPVVNGFCFLIKRKVIDKIGLLDEACFPVGYGEENDYCIRASDAGFSLAIADDCYVFHAKSKSFGHSQRSNLSAKGDKALREKHGDKRVSDLVKTIKDTRALNAVRKAVFASIQSHQIPSRILLKEINILFILPTPGAGGGSNSVVQEVEAMRSLGVNAVIGIESRNLTNVYDLYKDVRDVRSVFVGYDKDSVLYLAKKYDVVVATIYHSVDIVKAITQKYQHILPAYYVQDYEPMFFEKGSKRYEDARASYSLVDNMLLFAKTNWIARQVALFNGISVRKVSPSIDHSVYHPSVLPSKDDKVINLAAMIRPQTPYRGAERTMRILSSIKSHYQGRVQIQIFGCEESSPEFDKLENDFEYKNLGVIDRPRVASCLQNSDIFIDLSDYQAFGRTSLEAMACNCAAMLPCHGGGDEYAIDNYNALVVDTFNEEECYSRLIGLMDDSNRLKNMKVAGYETANRYSPRKAAISELNLISEYLQVHRNIYPKKDKPTVYVLPVRRGDKEPSGSAYVRLLLPYGNNSSVNEKWDIIISNDGKLPHPSEADIVIIQRDAASLDLEKISDWLIEWRVAGNKCILELDDDLFDIKGLNQRTGHTKGRVKEIVASIIWLASAADAVIVSTPYLGELSSKYNDNVFVIPNYLDHKLWGITEEAASFTQNQINKNKVVKIGYIGTPTHNDDLALITKSIQRIEKEYGSKVEVEVIGAFQNNLSKPLFGKSIGLPKSAKNTTYPNFVEWLKIQVDWDIAVIPLVDDRFNKSKSHLKFLECAGLGLPSICSNVPTYSSIVDDRKNGLLVDNKSEDWYRSIKLLIDNPSLRAELASGAYNDLSQKYTTLSNANLYLKTLSDVNRLSQRSDVPSIPGCKSKKPFNVYNANSPKSGSRRNRLMNKLLKDPHLYFSDSKNKNLRPIRFLFKKK